MLFGKKRDKDRMSILKMLSDGKINAQEANELLEALDESDEVITSKSAADGKKLKIIVDSKNGDKVNIKVPIALAKTVLKASGKANFNGVNVNEFGIDIDSIINEVDSGTIGSLVDIETADGDIVKITVE